MHIIHKALLSITGSIKLRILFLYALTAALTVCLISVVTGSQVSRRLTEVSVSNTQNDLSIISDKLDVYFNNIESYTLFMVYARQWQKGPVHENNTAYENFTQFRMVYAFLLDLVHANSDFQSVLYYENGQIYVSDTQADTETITETHKAEIEDFRKSKDLIRWLGLGPLPYQKHYGGQAPQCYTLLRKCFDTTGKFLGVIELNLRETAVANVYANHGGADTSYFIVGDDGRVSSSPQPGQMGQDLSALPFVATGQPEGTAESGDSLYVWKSYPRMGWTVVGQVPVATISQSASAMVRSIWLVGLVAIVASILVFAALARSITRPLDRITRTVSAIAGGDYGRRIRLQGQDEVAVLAGQIDQMAESTEKLMADIERENQQKRQFELSYIQSQMNPHFLYNSLETLCGMVEVGEYENTIEFIGEISRFYRSVLTRGDITVCIREELEIVKNYLAIMQRRYPGRFTYQVDCQEDIMEYRIAKLSLQPIAENAVVHGVLARQGGGCITLRGRMEQGLVRLCVEDNGPGLPGEKLAAIEAKNAHALGFGFSNTETRLRLQLGDAARVEVASQSGQGARVSLYLPPRKGEG